MKAAVRMSILIALGLLYLNIFLVGLVVVLVVVEQLLINLSFIQLYGVTAHYNKPQGAAKNTQCWVKKLQYLGLDYVAFFVSLFFTQ